MTKKPTKFLVFYALFKVACIKWIISLPRCVLFSRFLNHTLTDDEIRDFPLGHCIQMHLVTGALILWPQDSTKFVLINDQQILTTQPTDLDSEIIHNFTMHCTNRMAFWWQWFAWIWCAVQMVENPHSFCGRMWFVLICISLSEYLVDFFNLHKNGRH